MTNRPRGSGSISYARSAAGGSWVARAPQMAGGPGAVIGRYDTRAQAERALTAWVAERFAAMQAAREGDEE